MRRLHPWWILLVGFAGVCVYAYPGFMSYDSVVQLRQARSGIYGDAHPAAMAALWRLVEHVVSGPFGMLVLQLATFLGGGYLVMRRWLAPTGAAIAAVALLWFPPIGAVMAVIWKDSQMCGFTMLGLGLLLGDRRASQLGALIALGFASAMRHNGFSITFPLVLLLFRWIPNVSQLVRYAIALAAWLVITIGAFSVNAALTDQHDHGWQLLALDNLVGTVHFIPDFSDADAHELLDGTSIAPTPDLLDTLNNAYRPGLGVNGILDKHVFAYPMTDAQLDATGRAWKTVVVDHPFAYLRYRYHAFRALLQVAGHPDQGLWVGESWVGSDLVRDEPTHFQSMLRKGAKWIGSSWLISPFLYLLLLIALSPLWIRLRDRVLVALVLSAVSSEAVLYFLAPTPDYRYSIWMVIVAVIVVIATTIRRAARVAA